MMRSTAGVPSTRSGLTLRQLTRLSRRSPAQLDQVRLYLTARGTPMTAKLFRDHYWTPALRAAGLDADPHPRGTGL